MSPNIRTFIASCEFFSGFTQQIDLNYCNNLQDIIDTFKTSLTNVLSIYNFEQLVIKVNNCKFHIHDNTFENILLSDKETKFYICNHCYDEHNS